MLTILSTVLFVGSAVALAWGSQLNPWEHHIVLGPKLAVGVWGLWEWEWDTRVVIWDDLEYGPYRGSIYNVSDGQGPRMRGFDGIGIYYRNLEAGSQSRFWTLMVSLWYPVILFAILPVIYLWRKRRRHPDGSLRSPSGLRNDDPVNQSTG
jgi:hypothetical protein